MRGLGRVFDLGMVCPPAATNGAVTGKRIRLNKASGCAFVLIGGVATNGDDIQVDVQQYNVASGGSALDLDTVTAYHYKSAVAMDNSETWTTVTQAAASEIAVAAAANTDIQQNIFVVEVNGSELSDGYEWVSLNVPDLGAGDKTLTVIAILYDLNVQRKPANMAALI